MPPVLKGMEMKKWFLKDLNDLVHDLILSKDSAELLASRLKEKTSSLTVLASASSATGMKSTSIFSLLWRTWCTVHILRSFCSNLECHSMNPKIGNCSLTAANDHWNVLLYNGNQFSSVPFAHSTTLKQKYEVVKYVLAKIGYDQNKLFICVDLKMVNFLFGQQSGLTKYPCFLCIRDSSDRAQHYTKKDWPLREELVPCKERNAINDPLVDRDRILFPTLHLKLSLIKQFTKALDKDGDCFTYLYQAFLGLIIEKLKACIFDGHQIRQLIRDPVFENSMNEVELEAWKAFVLVVKNFLGNNKARNYTELVNNTLTAFRNLGCDRKVKMHYQFSDMDRFPENLGSMSDEQGERFRQDLKEMETRYQGHSDAVMMADYGWNLKRDLPATEYSRSSKKWKFKP